MRWFPALMPPSGASAQHPLGGGGRWRVLRIGRSFEASAVGCRHHCRMPRGQGWVFPVFPGAWRFSSYILFKMTRLSLPLRTRVGGRWSRAGTRLLRQGELRAVLLRWNPAC